MLQTAVLNSLRTLLPKGQVFTDRASLIAYEVDAGMDRGVPEGVVFPKTADEVARVVAWAEKYHVPLIGRGAGTGLSGGAVADRGGVIVAFSHMNHILDVDVVGRSIVAEPAVINLHLDNAAKAHGLYFPPDPASQRASTIGGNVSENSGGPHCFKYGVTTNYITGLDVVLADGRRVRVGGRALDYPEYDLCGLITGSEGMLALITGIYGRLVRNPPGIKTLLAIFESVEQASSAVSAIIAAGLLPATMEMMDNKIINIAEPFAHAGLPLDAEAVLVMDVDGYPESLETQIAEIDSILHQQGVREIRISNSEEERAKIWLARKSVAGAITRLTPAYYTVDITVPRSKLRDILDDVNPICERYNLRVGYLMHAGDGNLHPMVLIPDPRDPELMHRVHAAGWEMVKCCVDMGGSLTGEHGVGIEKRDYMSLMHKPAELLAMWDVKQVFDPDNILNPGKLFPTPEDVSMPYAGYTTSTGELVGIAFQHDVDSENLTPTTAEEASQMLLSLSSEKREVLIGHATIPPREVLDTRPLSYATDAANTLEVLDASAVEVMMDEGYTVVPAATTVSTKPVISSTPARLRTDGLSGIKTYAPDDLYITAGAGTTLREVQDFLARDGKYLPLAAPWPDATLGGLVAANVNAPLRMRYGSLRDLLLYATVALADGRIIRTGRPIVKNVAGYDMTKIFVGSHGTLGLLTDVTFKFFTQPRTRRTLIVPVNELAQGLAYARQVLPIALTASAILLCKGCNISPVTSDIQSPYLLVYTAEGLPEDVQAELDQVRRVLNAVNAPEPFETEQISGTELWTQTLSQGSVVRVGLAAKDVSDYIHDRAHLLEDAPFIADMSSGCLYALSHGETSIEIARWLHALRRPALKRDGYAVVMSMPETMDNAWVVDRWGFTPQALDVMQRLKLRWDPNGVLNAGVFL